MMMRQTRTSRSTAGRLAAIAAALLLLSIACLSTSVYAFSDTAPLLAFTSRRSALLNDKEAHVPLTRRWGGGTSPASMPADVARTLTRRGKRGLCSLDGVAIVEVESLASHGFSTLPTGSTLQRRALEAPAQLSFGHITLNHGDVVTELKSALRRLCGATTKGQHKAHDALVTVIPVASLHDLDFDAKVDDFTRRHPEHLVVVAPAARTLHFGKRQLGSLKKGDDNTDGNSTSPVDPSLGLFHRYQFFSSGLLVGILVFAVILIPAAYTSLSLLATIETPDKLGSADKGRAGQDKKAQ